MKIFSILLILPTLLLAGYIDYTGNGKITSLAQVTSYARGGAGLVSDPLLNPANAVDSKFQLYALIGIDYQTESETQTIYDSYNNRIGKLTTSQTRSMHFSPYTFLASGKFNNLGFGFFSGLERDYFYRYEDIIRNSFYQVTDEISLKGSGYGIKSGILFNYSFPFLSLGLSANYHMHNFNRTYSHIYYEPGRVDTNITEEFEESGLTYTFGSTFIYENISTALTFNSNYKALNIPSSVGFGFSYKIPGIVPAKIYCDFHYNFYNQLNDSIHDTREYNFGIENSFSNFMQFYLGAGLQENCFNSSADIAFFTGGFQFSQSDICLQTSFRYEQKQYDKNFSDNIIVHNNSTSILLGVSYKM